MHYWPFVMESTGDRWIPMTNVKKCGKHVMVSRRNRFQISPQHSYEIVTTLWRHQMETFSALLALYAGNSPVTGEFPAQRPVTRSFKVFFGLRLNKRLSKQSWDCWLRRHRAHCEVIVMMPSACKDICNRCEDIGRSVHVKNAPA